MDFLRLGLEKLLGTEKEVPSDKENGGFFEGLFKNKETKESAEKISSTAKQERTSLWGSLWEVGGEWAESLLGRFFPRLAKYAWAIEGIIDYSMGAEEDVPWEQEFKMIIGATALIPDFMLRPFTDVIKKPILAILDSGLYPGGEKLADKIREDDDPDDLIEVVAIMNQDIITQKVTLKEVWKNVIGSVKNLKFF